MLQDKNVSCMMFKEGKPIYWQIADRIGDDILSGKYQEEERIPSVREFAALMEVNANTTMRAYEFLQNRNIIYMKRGIGYFVSSGARELVLDYRKNTFIGEELNSFFHEIYTLGIPIEEIVSLYKDYVQTVEATKKSCEENGMSF
jgi:DNA-binding transcriptional regulator YhcF (GntR family)